MRTGPQFIDVVSTPYPPREQLLAAAVRGAELSWVAGALLAANGRPCASLTPRSWPSSTPHHHCEPMLTWRKGGARSSRARHWLSCAHRWLSRACRWLSCARRWLSLCMGPLAPCIHPARQGLTAVDGVGWGRVRLLHGAAGVEFHSVGVLMVSGVHWVTASHIPCGFLTAQASQHLLTSRLDGEEGTGATWGRRGRQHV
jgi:hypothetical protein